LIDSSVLFFEKYHSDFQIRRNIKKYIQDLHRTEKLNNLKLDFSQFCRILEKFGKMKLRVDIFSEIKVEIGSPELIQVKNCNKD
jgi:myosin-crossreactive antigen